MFATNSLHSSAGIKINLRLIVHVVIALLFTTVFSKVGAVGKYAFIPYVVYLIYSPREAHVLPLIIIILSGTTLSYFSGIIMIPFILINLKKLKNVTFNLTFLLVLLMLPLYIYNTYIRLGLGYNFQNALTPNGYYLSYYFFFYGLACSRYYTDKVLNYIIKFYFIFFLIWLFLPFGLEFHRSGNFIRIIFFTITFLLVLPHKRINIKPSIRIISIIFILIDVVSFYDYKFTFIVGLLFSIFLSYYLFLKDRQHLQPRFAKKVRGIVFRLLFFIIGFTALTLYLTPVFSKRYKGVEMTYNFFSNIFEQVMFKLFVDRGLLWQSALDTFFKHWSYFPPIEKQNIVLEGVMKEATEVSFESHNLLIELVRSNGLIFGVILIFLYFFYVSQAVKGAVGSSFMARIYAVAFVGLGVSVFITGQYTLQFSTSFLFMSVLGAISGRFFSKR